MVRIREVVTELHQRGIDFIIIGGIAAGIHGSTYTTEDFDVCYSRTEENLKKLSDWLQIHHARLRGAPADLPFTPDVLTLRSGLNFTLETDLGDIDFFGEIQSVGYYSDVLQRSVIIEVYDIPCRIINLETLIAVKRKTGRSKDIAVAIELEAIKELLEKKSKR